MRMAGEDGIDRGILESFGNGHDWPLPRHGRRAGNGIAAECRTFMNQHDLHVDAFPAQPPGFRFDRLNRREETQAGRVPGLAPVLGCSPARYR